MKKTSLTVFGLSALLLTGCGVQNDFADLQVYMDEMNARPVRPIEPIPQPVVYEPFTYSASNLRSPFQPPIKLAAIERQKGQADVRPDETRVKQFLEGFNIEIFDMVGTLSRDGQTFGLVGGVGGVHRVKVGDYVGRNHGRIIAVGEAKIDVVEIVPDGDGGWLERPRSISLKERS